MLISLTSLDFMASIITEVINMVTIIYGLGNNELKFLDTKHNVGRIVTDLLVKNLNINYKTNDSYSWAKISDKQIYFLRTNGYMNNSGEPLASFINYFKLNKSSQINLLVFHDDSDQHEGNLKFSVGGRSAGNKGVDSIYKHLPKLGLLPENVWRLKIGIRPNENRSKSATFVLKKINQKELNYLIKVSDYIKGNWSLLEDFQPEKLQNHLNGGIN